MSEWGIGLFHTSNSWRKCLRARKASTRLVCVCVCVCVFVDENVCVCVCVLVSAYVRG